MPDVEEPRRSFKRHFHNWSSYAGLLLAASALFAFLFLFAIDLLAANASPYVGILAYVVAPFFFLLGTFVAVFGALLAKRRERLAEHGRLKIRIDFSRPRDRRILLLFSGGAVAFLFLTALGSYETYHYTESVEFCGKSCHVPMQPEFV